MAEKGSDSIEYILNSELSGVLSAGFAELYRVKPDFPVQYLAKWLKRYSSAQKDKEQNSQLLKEKLEVFAEREKQANELHKEQQNKCEEMKKNVEKQEQIFHQKINQTTHMEDLLENWLPEYLQARYELSGAYIGNQTHPHKQIELHNYEPGAEYDTESPKIIQYIGASNSQKDIMMMKILPHETGVSYPVFNDPEPEEGGDGEGEDQGKKQLKSSSIYVPDVTKEEKVYYFKYPRLGSYACFPLKLKSFLTESSFDQGLVEYREYVKNKQETEKDYHEKLNEARQQHEQLRKKADEFEIPEQQQENALAQKKTLDDEANTSFEKLSSLEKNPPIIPLPNFLNIDKIYMVGCDTLGQDKKISEKVLKEIEEKTKFFKHQYQQKQRKMLLNDILLFIEDEPRLEGAQNSYRELEKTAISQSQDFVKQKFSREKQMQYETTVNKVKKMEAVFSEIFTEKSMEVYFTYNVPKYQQIYQVALMLLGYKKQDINLPRKNILDYRKVRDQKFIQIFLNKLFEYELRRESSEAVEEEYKINKLLERLEKIDMDQVCKYNTFIWVLGNHVKLLCWSRIQCRDAKIESHQYSVKAKEERDAEIVKHEEELEKALEAHKQDLGENLQGFDQQEWKKTYLLENQKPLPLNVEELKTFLDIQ